MNIFSKYYQWIRNFFRTSSNTQQSIVIAEDITHKDKQNNTISTHTFTYGQITLFWVMGALVAYGAYLIFNSLSLLYLILTGGLISVSMEGFIQIGERWMKRGVAITVMYAGLILFLLTGVVIMLPFLLKQISTIVAMTINQLALIGQHIAILGLDGYIRSLEWIPTIIQDYLLSSLGDNASKWQTNIMNNISSLISMGSTYASNIGSMALSALGSIFSVIGQVAIVLTIAIFFSIEKEHVVRFVVHHTSNRATTMQKMAHNVDIFYKKMGTWLKTQFLLCMFIFTVVFVVLHIASWFGMSLPNIFSLALMAGFTEFIPYIGPILGAIPSVLVATMLFGRKGFIIMTIIFVAIQQIENNVLVPLLMNKSLGVSPLLILLCALFFGSALGFIGVLLAVPFAILITMVVKRDFE